MKYARTSIVTAAALLMALSAVGPGLQGRADAATDTPGPRAVMEKVIQDALAVLRDSKLSADQRHDKIRTIAYASMDFPTMARFSLGQNWRGLTAKQRADFIEAFKQHLADTYRHTTDEYTDEDIKISGDHKESDGDWTIQTSIIGTENGVRKKVAEVDYRLRKSAAGWKIDDVIIDNVSLVANFRSQFQDIITNGGFDALMKQLQKKNVSEK